MSQASRQLSRLALLAAVGVTALALPSSSAVAISFPPPLGACSGPDCLAVSPTPPNNGDFAGRDATINIFTGGDYLVTGRAAEAEGKIVTLGNLTVDKDGGGLVNLSVVGVGSRVPPPTGSDFVTVGGEMVVKPHNRVEIGGSDSHTTAWGNLRHGGTVTGTVRITPDGKDIHDPGVAARFGPVRTTIEDFSACSAKATATGTVVVTNSEATFTGDGTSARQVFNVSQNLASASGGQIGLVFRGIPAGATVLVNMLPDDALINTYTGTGDPADPTTILRPKLIWNFPTSSKARITGGSQFQGSVLSGNPNGVTTISAAGLNGRVYLAGSLIQSGTGGYEMHAHPFTGDLPDCSTTPPTPPPTPPTPSPTPPTPPPTPPTPPPTPPTPTPTPTPTWTRSPHPTWTRSPRPTWSESGKLPDTGSTGSPLLLAGAAVVLLLGGSAAVLIGRRRGRHG